MILDIKQLAQSITDEIKTQVSTLEKKPQLTIVMVGNNSASEVYVRNKIKMCEKVGISGVLRHESETITESDLIEIIKQLNEDDAVTGILVQSPLPSHIDAQKVFDMIDSTKDVDGFSSANITKLYSGNESGLMPGTPKGVMEIIQSYFSSKKQCIEKVHTDVSLMSSKINSDVCTMHHALCTSTDKNLEWKTAVVIGKSTIVGKPLAMMLLHAWATVTVCHSRTNSLEHHTKQADIIISAVGKKYLITADMVKPGSLVIDVGINVVEEDEKRKLFGDCDTEEIGKIADVTPVPGGVGPMTIAMLLSNVLLTHTLQWKK